MPYRDLSNGTKDSRTFNLYGYAFELNFAKTITSIGLPNNSKVKVIAFGISAGVPVSLSSAFNRANGIVNDGSSFSGGGLDNNGWALSAEALASPVNWTDLSFNLGPTNTTDVISCSGQTVALTAGKFSMVTILATAVNGNQPNQTFTIEYSDSTTAEAALCLPCRI